MDPFDPEPKWLNWAFGHQGIPFFMHWATDEPGIRARNLQKMAVDGWRPKVKQQVALPPPATLLSVVGHGPPDGGTAAQVSRHAPPPPCSRF
jgi:hypothetical protein